jgi:hypothetical protein
MKSILIAHPVRQRLAAALAATGVALLLTIALPGPVSASPSGAVAQAPAQQTAAAPEPTTTSTSIGGWNLVRHWTYDEVQANKDITNKLAGTPPVASMACEALAPIPYVGRALAVYCHVYLALVKSTAQKARAAGHCFRFVVPAHNPQWTYPSTYSGGWCR